MYVKSADKKTTLIRYLASMITRNFPEVSDFDEELKRESRKSINRYKIS